VTFDAATFRPDHFLWELSEGVATVTLNRPERKNPLTFESYAELRDTFRALTHAKEVKTVVIRGEGGNFCSGGDVHEIIGPLTKLDDAGLLKFTTMTGDLVKAIRACPQPIIAAVEGVCAGAGAILAMASDIRFASPSAKAAFLFTRVGLSGADMGACAILPRIIGHGRAAELLFTGRSMSADEGLAWGFWNRVVEDVLAEASALALELARGPTFAHAMTKRQLDGEWHVSIDEAITMEAEAQAICM
jgi:enoyl-CoA hydratase/carnithine racemase